MKNVFQKVEELKEEFEQENEETSELLADIIKVGGQFYNKTKRQLVTRGFIYGALSAVAIQSLLTIWVLLGNWYHSHNNGSDILALFFFACFT